MAGEDWAGAVRLLAGEDLARALRLGAGPRLAAPEQAAIRNLQSGHHQWLR